MKTLRLALSFGACFIAGYLVAVVYHPTGVDSRHQTGTMQSVSAQQTTNSRHDTSSTLHPSNNGISLNMQTGHTNNPIVATPTNKQALEKSHQEQTENKSAQRFDALKHSLRNDPNSLNDTISQLENLSIEDPEFNLLISAIKGASTPQSDAALFELAEQYAMQADPQTQQKFIAILASTSTDIQSEHLVNSLVDMAVMNHSDNYRSVEALNLIKPYQLSQADRDILTRELESKVFETEGDEAEMLLSQLMRFSASEQRSKIASNMLEGDSNMLKEAVFDSINSGSIPAAEPLKILLLDIAFNQKNPLSGEAQYTLLNNFALSQQEYSQLQNH
ncbi:MULTISPECIES: hypothetical protein [unclassified Agarivorans]|uniref:hypothetical protein n=1 Tax=unclassified Agarivorans TaxID=2636026 RepID=UPI0026E16F35|nr:MULTISPECIES: hypothetical protein [unclassified Agarivorans]MDO6686171.1 hypothetical protein [Agarivorans sp. 3_MG-2023]MDO6716380.1 hypothetical protein [Agarivorans sp. 2_MG-2023]